MRPKDYPNIIFDLGGVILNIDYQRTIDAFIALGLDNFEASYSQLAQTPLFDEFERGEITPESFRDGLRKVLGESTLDETIDTAWNAMLLDLPSERLAILERLGTEKHLALLSNTNITHVNAFESEIMHVYGIPNLGKYFEKTYYSCDVGMRKPEARIFQLVLDECNFKPEETLFIDDSIQHIEGAQKVGLNTYHLRVDKGETIADLF